MNATVYIATSLDGFIAREDGSIDWLTSPETAAPDGEDYGYQAFFDSVDALVMGRNTFDLVRTFGIWPYGDKPVIVLTSRPTQLPDPSAPTAEVMSGSPTEIARRLRDRGFQHIYVDGGKTIQGFIAAGLIQRLIVTRIPVLIGAGIPLFGSIPTDIRLEHVTSRSFPTGLVQSEYRIPAATTDQPR